jgi:hypothetical protein
MPCTDLGRHIMFTQTRRQPAISDLNAFIHHLHAVVATGPRDPRVVAAMRVAGYDDAKWAEGQGLLAALVMSDAPDAPTLHAAEAWYAEAATSARRTLAGTPRLLARLGLGTTAGECR